jgi:hypothetical protein
VHLASRNLKGEALEDLAVAYPGVKVMKAQHEGDSSARNGARMRA